ncbi:anaerobic ribonucleoside triphosphate reductase (plasmid) [Fulvitalea axinellae]|uniref:Anaerobic ribonucleoside triphosphate reductase n=1 Tax=Fulvitalea axinellae TaxID=1182444 RepID=A0AAU9DM27_9BACT|nr:anaerobic ribonucleoside triphosphate reductase [Fulvitalea axinellae]
MTRMITKRNGTESPFEKTKILNAVLKACASIDAQRAENSDISRIVSDNVSLSVADRPNVSIYEIERRVEDELMRLGEPDIAREYIEYKTKRKIQRDGLLKYVDEAVNLKNLENENANMPEKVFTARMTRVSGEVMREYAKHYLLPEEHTRLHGEGWIYIHDFNAYTVGQQNCMFLDMGNILSKPIHTTNGTMRPPKSISSALSIAAVVIQCQSNCQFGGISVQSMDYAMQDFIKLSFDRHLSEIEKYREIETPTRDAEIDNQLLEAISKDIKIANASVREAYLRTVRETEQACEAFIHNLNHLESRAGNQLPFSSINYGCCETWAGKLFIRSILKATIDGIGEKRSTPIFPQQIWQYHKKEDGTVNNADLLDLAHECSIKRVYPNYVNCNQEVYDIYDEKGEIDPDKNAATMGCRTRLGANVNGSNGKTGRGNLSPVTLNFPKIALETKTPEAFVEKVTELAYKGIEMMEARFKWQSKQVMGSAPFMYLNKVWKHNEEYSEDKKIGDVLATGTFALGFIGVAEASKVLFGDNHFVNKEADAFFFKVCSELKKICEREGIARKRNISLYATPAESLCHSFAKLLRKQYGVIEDVTDKEFITNSYHVPVWQEVPWFDKIETEGKYHALCTGGCITYIELRNDITVDQYKDIVSGAMERGLYYFCTNIPKDKCLDCGFEGIIGNKADKTDGTELVCHECGSDDVMTLRRVTGYITGSYHKRFNDGKKQEVNMRVKHH